MFDSPEESNKRILDTIEMEEEGEDVKIIDLEPYISLIENKADIVKNESISNLNETDYDQNSIVTISDIDFDLSLGEDELEETPELESYGSYGYNFDQYLEQFPSSSSQLFKGILKITRDFNTHAAAIIREHEIVVNLAVNEEIIDLIIKEMNEGVLKRHIGDTKAVVIKNIDKKPYSDIFNTRDNFNEAVIIPIKYKNIKSNLILFYPEMNNDIINVFESLNKK